MPKGAGIYAWYIDFEEDMRASLRDPLSFNVLMNEYLHHLDVADLEVSVKDLAFPIDWKGRARSEGGRVRAHLEQAGQGSPEVREAIWAAFLQWKVSPIFSSPLYIGKSTDLRTRLRTHVRLLELNLPGGIDSTSPSSTSEVGASDDSDEVVARNFAERCARQGIPMARLQVIYCSAEQILQPIRKMAVDVVEETLNSWYRPRLGRR